MLKLNERGWRDIEGYEGLYQVHRLGYIRNRWGKVIKTGHNNTGYETVRFQAGKKKKRFLVHRLVAIAFVKNKQPDVFLIVNHKDGVKTNNGYRNLEWCNNSYNILHARRLGLNPYNKPGLGQKFGRTSKYHGVGFDEGRNKWYSGITHENRIRHRRRFDTEREAAKHYNWILKELGITDRPRNKIK